MENKSTWKILLLLVLSISILSCSKESSDDADVKPRAIVKVAFAYLGNIDNVVNANGSFEVIRDEKIKSSIAGKVEKVFVLEGDFVQKGQVVATVVSQESFAAISGATQLLNQATTEAEKTQAEEALDLARTTATSAKILAPFAGAVTHRFVTEGELVSQGTDLVEIIDPSTEFFVADISINYISSIKAGQSAVVTIPGMDVPPSRGVVQAINPATDPNSQSVQVRIGLRSIPAKVAAGTFGNVQINIGERNSVVLVPKQAVYHDDELDRYFVWRIQGDSLAIMTPVNVGLSDSTRFQITSGIKSGDVVATVGGYGLPDSTDVSVSTN
ncbi:MAG: efflux RND transporter periplasmic adaptor subunit [Candidatus Kryptoniota bacterium]